MAGNGREWSGMAGDCQGLLGIARDCQGLPGIARDCQGWLLTVHFARVVRGQGWPGCSWNVHPQRSVALCDFFRYTVTEGQSNLLKILIVSLKLAGLFY